MVVSLAGGSATLCAFGVVVGVLSCVATDGGEREASDMMAVPPGSTTSNTTAGSLSAAQSSASDDTRSFGSSTPHTSASPTVTPSATATLIPTTTQTISMGVTNQTPPETLPDSGETSTDDESSTGKPSETDTFTSTAPVGGTSNASVFPPDVVTPKIMIVGDSVSAGPGCYKGFLDRNLRASGITNYEFVGKYDDECGDGVKHSAVSCSTTSDYTKDTFVLANESCARTPFDGMSKLCAAFEPDVILLQLGVNDVWGGSVPVQAVLDNYTTLVAQARAHNPNIIVFVAQIQKINTQQSTTPCAATEFSLKAQELVDAVPAWARETNTEVSPVFVADLWTNSTVVDTKDCVHPNTAGDEKMGQNWYQALNDILR